MTLALVLAGSILIGYAVAEIIHRSMIKKMEIQQRRNALIAEFIDKQIWQFLSLEEWLEAELRRK